jgi:hypothetical protein
MIDYVAVYQSLCRKTKFENVEPLALLNDRDYHIAKVTFSNPNLLNMETVGNLLKQAYAGHFYSIDKILINPNYVRKIPFPNLRSKTIATNSIPGNKMYLLERRYDDTKQNLSEFEIDKSVAPSWGQKSRIPDELSPETIGMNVLEFEKYELTIK